MKTIPKIIHQTWKTADVPQQWQSSTDKYRALKDQGFEYKLWTDEDNRNLIKDHFPWFLQKFDAYKNPIQRADAVRYFILYKYGGIYSDLDIQPKDNFCEFYEMYKKADVCLPSTKHGNSFGDQNISNCFMMSQAESAFWPLVWKRLQEPFKNTHFWKPLLARSHYFEVLFTTGPGIICEAYKDYEFREEIVKIPAQLVQPGQETDKTPFGRAESVVELLKGESWQQDDANVWRSLAVVGNNLVWVFLALFLFFFLVSCVFASMYFRQRKRLQALESRNNVWMSKK